MRYNIWWKVSPLTSASTLHVFKLILAINLKLPPTENIGMYPFKINFLIVMCFLGVDYSIHIDVPEPF